MDGAQIHLWLNHFPVMATMIGFLVLFYGLIKNSGEAKKIALAVFVLSAAIAVPVYLTGEPAEEIVEEQPGIIEDNIEAHEDAALNAFVGMEILGLLSLAGLLVFRGDKPFSVGFSVASLLVAVAVIGLMTWTAHLGGKINHPELSGLPVYEQVEPLQPDGVA